MLKKTLLAIFLLSLVSFASSLPLSTNKRWVVDAATGQRVKLNCVNWATHLKPMLAEGLNKRPLEEIVGEIAKMHFNCVRLTWPTFMFTRASYGQVNVAQTFDSLGLKDAKEGIAKNNPFILNMTHIQAYEAVVDELGAQGIMVLLDNHISKPDWCCSNTDGNGFFFDEYFHPDEWLQGLTLVAKRFKRTRQVVAISMRNELRGSRQNKHDWYKYISEGVRRVHQENPNVLISVSGLNFDTDLSLLKEKPLAVGLDNKIVYEIHWYSFSQDRKSWEVEPLNRICNRATQSFIDKAAYLTYGDNPVPLFLGEFGFDERGVNAGGNYYITCLMAYATERNLDWALWALQGSYYLRQGLIDAKETFGALDDQWQHRRNPKFIEKLRLMRTLTQDPNSNYTTSYTMFHPESGNCVSAYGRKLYASNSRRWSRWSYMGDGSPIVLLGKGLCLKVVGNGLPPLLSHDCSSEQSAWTTVSLTKMHLAAKDKHGELLCLQKSSISDEIITNKCICIEDDSQCMENPQSQWFKFVLTNVK